MKQELRKAFNGPSVCLVIVSELLLMTTNIGYMDPSSGKTYTVLELLFQINTQGNVPMEELNWIVLWSEGFGAWVSIFIPMILSVCYLRVLSTERQNGNLRFVLMRTGIKKYCMQKTLCAAVTGGCLLLAGSILYGLLLMISFPVPVTELGTYGYTVGTLAFYMVGRMFGIFFYGAMLNAFCLLVSIFLEDRYLLICLPMMRKYIYSVVVTKIESNVIEMQNELLLERVEKFRLETILDFSFTKEYLAMTGIICFTYVVCWRVFAWMMKKRRDCGA